MLESSSGESETRPDNSVVEGLDADDYCTPRKKSNNDVNNFVDRGINGYYDETTTPNDENVRTSEIKSSSSKIDAKPIRSPEHVDDLARISREVDSSATVVELERGNTELTRDSWMERITNNFIGDVVETQESYFVTGSSYEGSWDALGMAGVGRYVMPNGTTYKGELRDGMFHGRGSLHWSKKGHLDVVHVRGELKEHRYVFDDGLVYEENNWNYCKFPDRRFFQCKKKGLRPGGRTLKTARQPTTILPFNCYDIGDGVYDPKTMCVTSYDDPKKVLRIPLEKECEWIVRNCRKSWTEPTGYRPELNENWSDDPPELPYNLAMSEDSPDLWWQRLTTFARDLDCLGGGRNDAPDRSYSSPEVCMCGKYVILGEPCHCTPISVTSEGEGHEVSEGMFSEQPPYYYHYKDDGGEQLEKSFAPSEDFSVDLTPDFATVETDRLEKIRHIEKKKQIQSSAIFSEIDVDFSSSTSNELSEDSSSRFADKKSKKTGETGKRLKDVKIQQVSEKTRQREHKKEAKGKDKVKVQSHEKILEKSDDSSDELMKNEVLQKFGEDRDERNNEKLEGPETDKIPKKVDKELGEQELESRRLVRRSAEKSHKEKHELPKDDILNDEILEKNTEEKSLSTSDKIMQRDHKKDKRKKDLTNEQSHEKSGERSDVASIDPTRKELSQKFSDETGKEQIEESAGTRRDEIPREITEVRREQDFASSHSIKETNDQKSVEKSPKVRYKLADGDVHDEEAPEKNAEARFEVSDDKREISLEKSDYETISARGEKVARSVEPETGDDRRPKTKLLKETAEKYHDRSTNDNEIGSVEKKSQSDLTTDRARENNDNVVEYSTQEADMKSEEKVFAKATIEEKIHGNVKSKSDREKSGDEILSDETKNKKMREDEMAVGDEIPNEIIFPSTKPDIVDKTKSDERSRLELFDEKMTNQTEKKIKIGVESQSKETGKDNLTTNVVYKKVTERSVLKSVEGSSEVLKSTTIEKSSSITTLHKEEVAKSSVSLKDELASMDKVHPSLTSLASTKRENVPREKEIIEIYKGKPRAKPKIESRNPNVWRLSGVNEDYGPKTKIENLLFHPALTAPRSENVEYVRKPCDFRVCEPTIREVRPNASRPRKECPIDVPTKSALQSTAKCIIRGKKSSLKFN